jgi:hypothetical protein
MKAQRLLILSVIVLLAPIVAAAAPGDPRLVVGVLEWPKTLASEPFVIVRGDDGVLYYASVATARHDSGISAGARVAMLGIEGRSAHEITAIGLGSGATAEAALASLQNGRAPGAPPAAAAPPVAAPPAAASTPAGAPAPAVTAAPPVMSTPPTVSAPATPPAAASTPAAATPQAGATAPGVTTTPAATAPAAPPTTATPPAAPSSTPVTTPTPPPASAPMTVTPSAPAPAVAAPATHLPASRGAAAAAPATSGATATTHVPAALPVPIATAPMLPVDDRRWTELTGEVESIIGRTLVLKVDGGRVTVDVSSLTGNVERMVTPGSKVKVYGVPVELRFKAMGFIDPFARPRTR